MLWRKKKPTLTADDYFRANDAVFLRRYPVKKAKLLETERQHKPDDCLCCLFFKWQDNGDDVTASCAAEPDLIGFEPYKVPDGCPIR